MDSKNSRLKALVYAGAKAKGLAFGKPTSKHILGG